MAYRVAGLPCGSQEFPVRFHLAGASQPRLAFDHRGASLLVAPDLGSVVEVADHVVPVAS